MHRVRNNTTHTENNTFFGGQVFFSHGSILRYILCDPHLGDMKYSVNRSHIKKRNPLGPFYAIFYASECWPQQNIA